MKTHIRVVCICALALPLGTSGCKKQAHQAEAKPDANVTAKLEAIRQAGQPLTFAELDASYVEPAAGENAAPLYEQAFAALVSTDPKAKGFLDKNQKAIALLHNAAAKDQCRYPVDLNQGPATRLPHLSKIKACAQLLGQEATAQAAKGRTDLAAQALTDGLRLARSLDQEPVLISQLVRLASDAIVLASLEAALNTRPFPAEQLVQLQAALAKEETSLQALLPRTFAAERCFAIYHFQMPLQDYEKLTRDMGTNWPIGNAAEFQHYRQSAAFNADFNLCLDYYSNWLAVASAPFPACLEAADQWAPEAAAQISQAKDLGYRISPVVLPELNKTIDRVVSCLARLRAAQAAVAIEHHRAAGKSSPPESLAELARQDLAAVSADPYDGKPLHYEKLAKGYVVYSVGPNRRDDGGTPKPAGVNPDGAYDVTFALSR